MITEAVFNLLFLVVDIVINCFPSINIPLLSGSNGLVTLLSYGLVFFPVDLWIALISNISFWLLVQGGWIVIEWVYKKIPGVD